MPGATVNRLCGSGMDAVGIAARAIKSGEAVADDRRRRREHVARAVRDGARPRRAFSRAAKIEDTTIGWRFVNPLMKAKYGVDSMPETAENVAAEFKVARADQDAFALRSQQRAAAAIAAGGFAEEIVPVTIAQKKGEPVVVEQDEHPRETTLEALAKLKGVVRPDGTVTAGNASGVNDGALRAAPRVGRSRASSHGLTPRARVRRDGGGRRGAAHHGHRPGAGDAQGARAGRADARPTSTSSS